MENFLLDAEETKFEIVFPDDFDHVIESAANAFYSAEQDSDEHVIPWNRRAVMIDARLRILSEIDDVELHIQHQLQEMLSNRVSDIIGRECGVQGVFGFGVRQSDGKLETTFTISFVVLAGP